MTSKVDICNMALSRLGASPITALTDNTPEAKRCNTFFNIIAERVMTKGSWTSTIRRAELAQTINVPSFGFAYEYQLPVDPKCLKVLNVDEVIPGTIDFRKEGDKILTDEPTLKIRYIAYLESTEDWDAYLVEAVEILLASYLAGPITGKDAVAQALLKDYEDKVNLNLALDGQQGSKDTMAVTDLLEVR